MIHLKKISWKNFLSYGNYWTTVDLNTGVGTLIVGTNGAGKSTMLDALCFGLFGKPFRKITKPKIPNSINERETVVMVEFDSAGKSYVVARGMKPDKLEMYVDGVKSDRMARSQDQQRMLEAVVGFNLRSFTQVVVLGTAQYQPFMQMSTAARRDFVEDLLDIKILGEMSTIVKRRAGNCRTRISESTRRVGILEERLSGKRELEDRARRAAVEETEALEAEIAELEGKIETAVADEKRTSDERLLLADDMRKLEQHRSDLANAERNVAGIVSQARSIQAKIKAKIESGPGNCDSCGSPMDEKAHADSIARLKTQLTEVARKGESCTGVVKQLTSEIEDMAGIEEDYALVNSAAQEARGARVVLDDMLRRVQTRLSSTKQSVELTDIAEEIRLIEVEISDENGKLDGEREELIHVNAAAELLKDDGIKSTIVTSHLAVINRLVNEYLDRLGFNISFHLDDQFSEEIRSRGRDKFSYYSFSEGEKRRIDLAMLFAWREVARLRNSAATNLIVMDEVMDGSLDSAGIEDFVSIMGGMREGTTPFVISHNPEFTTKFGRILRAEKVGGFSKMVDATTTS